MFSVEFPLPVPTTPSELKLCRDGFLKKLCKDMKLLDVPQTVEEAVIKFHIEPNTVLTAEGMAFGRLLGVIGLESSRKLHISGPRKRSIEWTLKSYSRMVKRTALHIELILLYSKLNTIFTMLPGNIGFLPYNMFSWSLEAMKTRQELKNFLFIDLLERELPINHLDILKFKIDIYELMNLIQTIDVELYDDINLCDLVVPQLRRYQQGLRLEKESCQYMEELRNKQFEMISELFKRKHGHKEFDTVRGVLEGMARFIDYHAPIESRYTINWHSTASQQAQLKFGLTLQGVRKEIDRLRKAIEMDNFSNQCSLNMLFILIEKYKNRYEQLALQFDTDLDAAENTVNVSRNNLAKAKDDFKFLQNNVIVMRAKVEKVRLLIAAEDEARAANPEGQAWTRKSKHKSSVGKRKSSLHKQKASVAKRKSSEVKRKSNAEERQTGNQ